MKVGINLLLWTGAPDFSKDGHILDKLKDWGFDAFEIGVGGLSASEVDKFASKAVALGLATCALDVYVASDMDIIISDAQMRRKAIDFLKSCITKT